MDCVRLEYDVDGENFASAGNASESVKRTLKQLGVSPASVRRVAIAMYEGEINMVIHAHGGKAVAEIRDFQLKTGARIYIGEFGVVGCAEGAAQWLTDAIEMFEEYGWDWTFHAFREWPPFSPEHETVYVGKPNRPYEWRDAEKDTDRKKAILEGLKRNRQLLP